MLEHGCEDVAAALQAVAQRRDERVDVRDGLDVDDAVHADAAGRAAGRLQARRVVGHDEVHCGWLQDFLGHNRQDNGMT